MTEGDTDNFQLGLASSHCRGKLLLRSVLMLAGRQVNVNARLCRKVYTSPQWRSTLSAPRCSPPCTRRTAGRGPGCLR